jgi:hypothetical protein
MRRPKKINKMPASFVIIMTYNVELTGEL